MIPIPVFFIDSSVLQPMFEGKNDSNANELTKKLKEMQDGGMKIKCITTKSCFLRAIWLMESNANVQNIQRVLSFLEVMPSFSDFKNEEAVRNEVLLFAKTLSKLDGGNNDRNN